MIKKFKGFTLVELLIVMGILAILMTIGISVGRFAIQRANNIQHQSSADQFGQAIQSFYTDNRRYPDDINGSGGFPDDSDAALDEYVDASFDGGAPASFYYATNTTNQAYLICVTYGGQSDADELGMYCTGDGFEDTNIFGGNVSNKELEFGDSEYTYMEANAENVADSVAQWSGDAWE
jgi:prepilin-type N-terminal cleavage/methylation domain-containing protein